MPLIRRMRGFAALFGFHAVSGCGLYVPEIQEVYESPKDASTMVQAIVEQVQCEVKSAVQIVVLEDMERAVDPEIMNAQKEAGRKSVRNLDWIDNWAAQATLTLTIDEKSALNPGLALNQPLPNNIKPFPAGSLTIPQSYSLGLGGSFSADATRKETLALFIDFTKFTQGLVKQFKAGTLNSSKISQLLAVASAPCPHENGVFIQSDLKLREWMEDVTLPAVVQDGIVPGYANELGAEAAAAKKDVISHEITFVIVYSGNITPTWKLVRVSANTGTNPLFGATRTKTQDLIITMGPKAAKSLSVSAQNTILASQIGQAVAAAIRNTQ